MRRQGCRPVQVIAKCNNRIQYNHILRDDVVIVPYTAGASPRPITKVQLSFHVFSSSRQRRLFEENHTVSLEHYKVIKHFSDFNIPFSTLPIP